ncbi:MAG: TIM-barrel domain-containing protein, partial [Chthoniobacterales bacterium]
MVKLSLGALRLWLALALGLTSNLAGRDLPLARAVAIGEGVAAFLPAGFDAKANPSFAVASEPPERGALPNEWKIKPIFSQEGAAFETKIMLPGGTSLYGTGETTGPLLRNQQAITLWNTDNFAYSKNDGRRLYQSHPWVLGVRADGSAFGVLFDTTWRSELKCTDAVIDFQTEGPPCRVIVIDQPSPQLVVRQLAELTGHMPLPALWSLGFQQCRYSYFPDARVRQIADEFRKRQLPCDVIWMDIDFMEKFKIFTFDPTRFPDPSATNRYLHEHGFHSVWMVDPGVKIEKGYSVYDSGTARDVWVKSKDGKNFDGAVWPGPCVFPDFTMPETRAWWAGLYKNFIGTGVDGVWNDMNEPAVFSGPDHSMPTDNQHRGGDGIPPGPHARYHNIYGMQMVRATREGVQAARPEKRPFVLTRSNFLGGQRYAATWTGDNLATWQHLKLSIPMSLNFGLSGQPFSGPDIGGYENVATPELYGHWISLGAFYPFARAHKATGKPNAEPWEFGPKIEAVARTALNRRYRLLPYFYTLFREASVTGNPVMRPLFFADPTDVRLRREEQAFLLGDNLLVIPRWAKDVALPRGVWRETHLLDGVSENDEFQPLVRLRLGSAIPLGRVIQNTTEYNAGYLTLLASPDENGNADGWLYEDAGDGFD